MSKSKKINSPKAPVTLKTVAEHVGLSSGTISLVLNNAPQASSIPQRTKDRVIAAARELGYQPNLLARALRTRQNTAANSTREVSGKSSGALMFVNAEHIPRAIQAIRSAGLSVPGDVSFVPAQSNLSAIFASPE
jgi:DNA-binding LacI/PurR family transcriptional regulator